jgi:hypothetical protein
VGLSREFPCVVHVEPDESAADGLSALKRDPNVIEVCGQLRPEVWPNDCRRMFAAGYMRDTAHGSGACPAIAAADEVAVWASPR